MRRTSIQDALEYCLANPDNLSEIELLARFPEHREQLQPLLSLAQSIKGVKPPSVPLERREAMKARLISASQGHYVPGSVASINGDSKGKLTGREKPLTIPLSGASAPTPALAGAETPGKASRIESPAAERQRPAPEYRTRRASIIPWGRIALSSAMAAALLVVFVWWSAAHALADSPFYDVKLATEQALVQLAADPAEAAKMHANLAEARLQDIQAMAEQGKLDAAQKALDDYDKHVNEGLEDLNKASGQKRADAAKSLYVVSLRGQETVSSITTRQAVSSQVDKNLQRTLGTAGAASSAAAQTLADANVNPASVATPAAGKRGRQGATATETARSSASLPSIPTVSGKPTNTTVLAGRPTSQPEGATPLVGAPVVPSAPTATKTREVVAGGGAPATPTTRAVVPPANTATNTPVLLRPQPTATTAPVQPTATLSGPTYANTATPMPVPPTATATNTHTPVPAATSTPTDVPRTSTPVYPPPPTNTPLPVPTTARETPTPRVEETETPQPTATVPATVCNLDVDEVNSECASSKCVDWSAIVFNDARSPVMRLWTAELQINMRGGGGYVTVTSQQGTATFNPGNTRLSGRLCYSFPAGTTGVRVRVRIDSAGYSCNPQGTSEGSSPCNTVENTTSTPEPVTTATNTPRPTRTPRVAATRATDLP